MKKYLQIITVLFLSTSILFSCKKDSQKDYTSSITGKTWWGMLKYPGQSAEYYNVHFKADNSLIWSQYAGDYAGLWVLEGKGLTLTFGINSVQIKADISENDSLLNITENTSDVDVTSGHLNTNTNLVLANTVWKGFNGTFPLTLNFMSGSKVEVKLGYAPPLTDFYIRSESGTGATILHMKFPHPVSGNSFPAFGIITSGSEIQGSYAGADNLWHLTKQ